MSRFKTYLCLIWASVLAASCVDTPASDEYVPGYEAHYLDVSQSELSFGSDAETKSFNIQTSEQWTISDYAPWLSLSSDHGEGDLLISVKAEENRSADLVRASIFYIKTTEEEWSYTKVMSAEQKAATPYILLYPESLSVSGSASSNRIDVRSNTEWIAKCNADWLDLIPSSDLSYIDINVSENLTNTARTADVILAGATTETFTVTQSPAILSAESNTLKYPQSGGSYLLKINSEVAWTAKTSYTWIDISPLDGAAGEQEVVIRTSPNWDTSSRYGVMGFYIGEENVIAVMIEQEGVKLSATEEIRFKSLGGSKTMEVNSNIAWKVLSKPSWVTVSPETSEGSCSVTVTADNNELSVNRSGTIKLGNDGVTLTADIYVSQEGKYFSVNNEDLTIGSQGGVMQVSIATNDAWEITLKNGSEWINFSEKAGEESRTVDFIISDNPSVKNRSETAVIATKDLGSVDILIRQAARYLTVDTEGVQFFSKGGTSTPVTISTDGKYAITKNAEWFNIAQDGDVFYVTADVNETGHIRSSDITIALTDLQEDEMSVTVTVTQVAPGGHFSKEDFVDDNIWDASYNSVFKMSVIGFTTDELLDAKPGSGSVDKDDYQNEESNDASTGSGDLDKDDYSEDNSNDSSTGNGDLDKDDYTNDESHDSSTGNGDLDKDDYTNDESHDSSTGGGNLDKEDFPDDDNYDNDNVE